MARKNDILVEEFAIGMGPILLKKQYGETLYSLRAFPIGGFCKMLGEDENSNDSRAFSSKSVSARIQVVIAGVVMNFILGFLVFMFIMSYEGFLTTTVSSVTEDYPAYNAGLRSGDKILELNGEKVSSYEEFAFEMGTIEPTDVSLLIDRNGEQIVLSDMDLKYNEEESRYLMGFSPLYKIGILQSKDNIDKIMEVYDTNDGIKPTKAGFFETIDHTFDFIGFYIHATISSLKSLIGGNIGLASGPIGLTVAVGSEYQKASSMGAFTVFMSMLNLVGVLSLALGIFNILPIPALDGGRLIFLLIEAVRGKPIDPEKEGFVHLVGFVCLMLLAVVVAYSDITKLL